MAYAEIALEAAKEDGRELRDADGHLSRKQIVIAGFPNHCETFHGFYGIRADGGYF